MTTVYNEEWLQMVKEMPWHLPRQGEDPSGKEGIEICQADDWYIEQVGREMRGTTTTEEIVVVKVKSHVDGAIRDVAAWAMWRLNYYKFKLWCIKTSVPPNHYRKERAYHEAKFIICQSKANKMKKELVLEENPNMTELRRNAEMREIDLMYPTFDHIPFDQDINTVNERIASLGLGYWSDDNDIERFAGLETDVGNEREEDAKEYKTEVQLQQERKKQRME